MKTIKNLLSIFVIITSLTFVSCENEPLDSSLNPNNNSGGGNGSGNGGNSGGNNSYYVKVKIDGVQRQWAMPEAFGTFMNNGKIYSVICTSLDPSNDEELILAINNTANGPVTASNYPFEWATITAAYMTNTDEVASAYSDFTVSPGGIIITQIDTANKTVKGTFTFVGKNDAMTVTKNFTDGEFFLPYP